MRKLFIFCLLFFTVVYISCSGQKVNTPSIECVALNNKGSDFLAKYPENGQEGLIKAINFFNQALKCDSTYLTALLNIAIAYDCKKDYRQELIICDNTLKLIDDNLPILTTKGMVFEKLNMPDSAKKIYELAKQGFQNKLIIHPKNTKTISGFLLILALTEGKESALKELDRRVAVSPELAEKMSSEYYFYKNFDKMSFMYNLTR